MRVKTAFLFLIALCAITSCKTYQVTRYKAGEIDKVGKIDDYKKVYVHYRNNIYKVDKPNLSAIGLKGELTPVKDSSEVLDSKNPTPHEIKKHKHDLNIYARTEMKDTAKVVLLKKRDISDFAFVTSKSKINWKAIGNGILTVMVIAFCIALIGAIVYWFTLI